MSGVLGKRSFVLCLRVCYFSKSELGVWFLYSEDPSWREENSSPSVVDEGPVCTKRLGMLACRYLEVLAIFTY